MGGDSCVASSAKESCTFWYSLVLGAISQIGLYVTFCIVGGSQPQGNEVYTG